MDRTPLVKAEKKVRKLLPKAREKATQVMYWWSNGPKLPRLSPKVIF